LSLVGLLCILSACNSPTTSTPGNPSVPKSQAASTAFSKVPPGAKDDQTGVPASAKVVENPAPPTPKESSQPPAKAPQPPAIRTKTEAKNLPRLSQPGRTPAERVADQIVTEWMARVIANWTASESHLSNDQVGIRPSRYKPTDGTAEMRIADALLYFGRDLQPSDPRFPARVQAGLSHLREVFQQTASSSDYWESITRQEAESFARYDIWRATDEQEELKHNEAMTPARADDLARVTAIVQAAMTQDLADECRKVTLKVLDLVGKTPNILQDFAKYQETSEEVRQSRERLLALLSKAAQNHPASAVVLATNPTVPMPVGPDTPRPSNPPDPPKTPENPLRLPDSSVRAATDDVVDYLAAREVLQQVFRNPMGSGTTLQPHFLNWVALGTREPFEQRIALALVSATPRPQLKMFFNDYAKMFRLNLEIGVIGGKTSQRLLQEAETSRTILLVADQELSLEPHRKLIQSAAAEMPPSDDRGPELAQHTAKTLALITGGPPAGWAELYPALQQAFREALARNPDLAASLAQRIVIVNDVRESHERVGKLIRAAPAN